MEIVSENNILKISKIIERDNYIIKQYEHKYNFIDQIVDNEILYNKKLQKLGLTFIPHLIAIERNIYTTKLYFEKIEGRVLSTVKFSMLEIDEKVSLVNKLLNVIKLLHMNNIVHNDIRLSNIIISNSNDIYLIDFALSVDLNEISLLNDINALNNIIFKVLNKEYEFENNDINSYIKKIGEIKYELLYKAGITFKKL